MPCIDVLELFGIGDASRVLQKRNCTCHFSSFPEKRKSTRVPGSGRQRAHVTGDHACKHMPGFKACSSFWKPQTTRCKKKPSKRSESKARTPGEPVSPLTGNFRLTNNESYVVRFTLTYYAADLGQKKEQYPEDTTSKWKDCGEEDRAQERKKENAGNIKGARHWGIRRTAKVARATSGFLQHHQRRPQSYPAPRDDENEISF